MEFSQKWLRASGIFGVLGGIVLFIGDLLFYYHPESTSFLENMANASNERIMISGVTALMASWFYLFGLGQIYFAFKPASRMVRNIVMLCFAAIFVAYGVIHGAYVAIATTAKLAAEHQLNIQECTSLAWETNNLLRLFVYPIFGLLSVVFIHQVWKKKTNYPRWMVFFFPLLPFLLEGIVSELLSGKIWIIVVGGYLNIILIIFFLASSIALWNIDVRTDKVVRGKS